MAPAEVCCINATNPLFCTGAQQIGFRPPLDPGRGDCCRLGLVRRLPTIEAGPACSRHRGHPGAIVAKNGALKYVKATGGTQGRPVVRPFLLWMTGRPNRVRDGEEVAWANASLR
jgi:hypothetical protein